MVKPEQIIYIHDNYPEVMGSNTELIIKFYEISCTKRGVTFPEELKDIMREFKPEAITRERRRCYPPTQEQLKEEALMYQKHGFQNELVDYLDKLPYLDEQQTML